MTRLEHPQDLTARERWLVEHEGLRFACTCSHHPGQHNSWNRCLEDGCDCTHFCTDRNTYATAGMPPHIWPDGTPVNERPRSYIRDVEGVEPGGRGEVHRYEVIWDAETGQVFLTNWPMTADVLMLAADAVRDMQAEHKWRGKLGGIE